MQTDAWLTDTSHLDCCPLCSQPLAGGSNICLSCGFTAHEPARNPAASPDTPSSSSNQRPPATPIPARASALHAQNPSGGAPRRSTLSQLPGSSSPAPAERARNWQHESSRYEVASSLSALSLLISETPTAPPRTTRRLQHQTGRLEHIDEIDTVPPTLSSDQNMSVESSEALLSPDSLLPRVDAIELPKQPLALSEASHSIRLSSIDEIDTLPEPVGVPAKAARPMRSRTREAAVMWRPSFNSTGSWHSRFFVSRPPLRQPRQRFTLLDRVRWWLVRPGHIEFLLWLFGSILLFGLIFLLLLVTVLSLQSPGSGNLPSSTAPSITATLPATGNPGSHSTPASPVPPTTLTPVHSQPTQVYPIATPVRPRPTRVPPKPTTTPMPPTPTPRPPTPTATAPSPGITPTVSPTVSATPGTPTETPTSTGKNSTSSPSLSNALNNQGGDSLFARLTHLNPLIWVIVFCYLLSMFFMGLAGMLRRRR